MSARRIDVFGNGRTAVKASIGRYNQLSRSDMTRRFHPFSSSVNTAKRDWNDFGSWENGAFVPYPAGDPRAGNYMPDCNVANLQPNGECGPITAPTANSSASSSRSPRSTTTR